jgi:predicted nucleotidyltransferase
MTVSGLHVDLARIGEICPRYGVACLEVCGSVSRGDARPDSDVDVLLGIPRTPRGLRSSDL